MHDTILFLKNNLADHFVVYFIPLYILGGRPVAVISAQMLGYHLSFILPVVVLLDMIQIPLFYFFYETISERPFIVKYRKRAAMREKNFQKTRIFEWVRLMGMPGIVALTMTPLKGCGMWSGVLLSKVLGLPKVHSYPLLVLGSLLGCLLLYGIGESFVQALSIFLGR